MWSPLRRHKTGCEDASHFRYRSMLYTVGLLPSGTESNLQALDVLSKGNLLRSGACQACQTSSCTMPQTAVTTSSDRYFQGQNRYPSRRHIRHQLSL